MFDSQNFLNHESVHFFSDEKSGLKAIIAIHNTARGPAAGGTRLWTYENPQSALEDALNLSRAMSFKNAMADIPFGGGKAVIMRPDGEFDRKALFVGTIVIVRHGNTVSSGNRYVVDVFVGIRVASWAGPGVAVLRSAAGNDDIYSARSIVRDVDGRSTDVQFKRFSNIDIGLADGATVIIRYGYRVTPTVKVTLG